MKVNSLDNKNISFNGFLDSKLLKKGLEFAADNGTLFAATTTLVLSTTVRPLAILATPKTDKKNKQVAFSKSITSTAIGYLIMLGFSKPLANSIKKINKNPETYLKKETIDNLKEQGKEKLTDSKAYSLATQLFKLGLGFALAAPKSILTAFGTPYIVNLFEKKEAKSIAENETENKKEISFKGKNKLSGIIGKILDKKGLQNFSNKYKNTNFPMHIIAATDTLATATFVHQTKKNKKLEEKDKQPLIYNSIISTTLSIITSYILDKLADKPTEKFIEKFKKANTNDPKLSKYLEGIKIAKPILIMGGVYYILIPIISTFLADRVDYFKNK